MCMAHKYPKHPEDKIADQLFDEEYAAERALEMGDEEEVAGYTEGMDAEGQEIMVPYYKKDIKKTEVAKEAPLECQHIANGCYTILNTKSGTHRTFEIRTARKGGLKGKRIVAMLTGSDNTRDYTGFGFLTNNGINVWNKHKGTKYTEYAIFLWQVLNGKTNPILEVKTEKKCVRCNRKLTAPQSIDRQIGPECAKK